MPPSEHAYVLMSADGRWWWDGATWQPTQGVVAGYAAFRAMPRELAMTLLRVSAYGMVAGLVVFAMVAQVLGQMQTQYSTLAAQSRSEQHQIASLLATQAEMQTTIDDLRSRWIGDPAIWQPPALPSNVYISYFDVAGATQGDLIQALDNDGLCEKYKCLVDPAVPSGYTWALEEDELTPNPFYCYSPRTLTFQMVHTLILPRWSPKVGAVKIDLVERWNALENVLFIHELGHAKVSDDYFPSMLAKSQQLPSCAAAVSYWQSPNLWDGLGDAQNAYHAKLRADCRPEIGCIPSGWMGW